MTTYEKKRLVAVFLLIFMVAASINWYFGCLFPRFARFIVTLGALIVAVQVTRFAPTRKEFEEHRRRHGSGGLMNRLLVVGALIRAILAGIPMLVGLCPVVCASDRDAVPDVKCVVVGIRMLQLTEPQQRTAGMMLAVYYLGRLDAGEPDTQVDGLIEIEAEKMTAAEFRSNAVRCGKALSMKGREIEMIGANLSNKAQGGGPPK